MKITYLSSKVSEQQKNESKNINELEQGITKRLLEKYKPKGLFCIDKLNKMDDHKRVA